MTGRDDHAAVRLMMVHSEERGRGGSETDIDHIAPNSLQTRVRRTYEHWPGRARVTCNHDARTRSGDFSEIRPERGSKARNDFRCKRVAHAATHARNTHHQIARNFKRHSSHQRKG